MRREDSDAGDIPASVVLFSPMIGLTRFARYAGVAGWPALLPRFSKSAWLEIVPEFNPFKYSSFPVNAARQSYELTQVLDEQFAGARGKRRDRTAAAGARLPVRGGFDRARRCAGQHGLFAKLPKNGSEIVVFDVNRATPLELLLSQSTLARVDQMLPAGSHNYRITVIGNAPGEARVSEQQRARRAKPAPVIRGRSTCDYPQEFFSLSHVAMPFPPDDSLYGTDPDGEDFGIHLGNQALRGELRHPAQGRGLAGARLV